MITIVFLFIAICFLAKLVKDKKYTKRISKKNNKKKVEYEGDIMRKSIAILYIK